MYSLCFHVFLFCPVCNVQVFLILQLSTDLALGDASITSVTEYLLTQPILSFVVCGCAAIPERVERDDSEGDSAGEEEDEVAATTKTGIFDSSRNVAIIKLHCVHTKQVMGAGCRII